MLSSSKSKELIKKSAIDLLFVEGKFNSTSQEIADNAGVKRPLIYYYFKSIEDLILVVLEETKSERDLMIFDVLNEEAEVAEKLKKIFDLHLKMTIKYPFRQVYIATHPNLTKANGFIQSLDYKNIMKLIELFREAIARNQLRIKDPKQALLLLFSYLNYPLLMISLGSKVLATSTEEYINLLNERKEVFINLLFNE